eukprot:TRINITY_DN15467_c0_g1_i1.p1 TRINITY_DN15467_c0_g1~~TRINITY_DN15467_c0_g1_i1.p1  ORF type:complete len:50 (+),score=5.59 TRINITY_DN15467_c0_g1_i1:70-219(+)
MHFWQIVLYDFLHEKPSRIRYRMLRWVTVATGLGDVLGNKGDAAYLFFM